MPNFQTEAIVPILSMKAKVSGVISYPVPPVVDPIMVAISKHELEVILEPTSSTPEAVLIEVRNHMNCDHYSCHINNSDIK